MIRRRRDRCAARLDGSTVGVYGSFPGLPSLGMTRGLGLPLLCDIVWHG